VKEATWTFGDMKQVPCWESTRTPSPCLSSWLRSWNSRRR